MGLPKLSTKPEMQIRLGTSSIKFTPQALSNDTVSRARLLARLDARRPLTLVEAPAGYGKTTLVIDWLSKSEMPYVWLSLDEYDNSLNTFLACLISSIRGHFPGACQETLALVNAATSPPDAVIGRSLTDELAAIDSHFVLVLDDYHTIKNLAIHQFLGDLLTWQPRNIEIVLITRHEPPLPLPAMRAHNRVTEIRTRELRFTHEESVSFLEMGGAGAFTSDQIEELEEIFEGWIVGLRMALLLRQQEGEGAGSPVELDRDTRYAAESLMQAVINNLSQATRDFLLVTSHANQVTAPLAAAMLVGTMSLDECRDTLAELARNNLFVFPVHGEELWYRYHTLFRHALLYAAKTEYSAEQIATLYARASEYLSSRGELDSALVYAIHAGNLQSVANLVRDHRNTILNQGQWSTLETWRRRLPPAMLNAHPQLLILDAWHFNHLGQIADVASTVADIARMLERISLPPDEARMLGAEIAVLRAHVTYWSADGESCVAWARQSLDTSSKDQAVVRAFAWLYYAGGLQLAGRDEEIESAIEAALREAHDQRGTFAPMVAHALPCFIYMHRGDMVRLDAAAHDLLGVAQGLSHLEGIAWGYFFRGIARYQRNDLTGAERDLVTLTELSYIAHPLAFSQAHTALAATYQAQGEYEKAYETAIKGWELLQQSTYSIAAARTEGMAAYLAFRQGRTDQAMHWVSRPLLVPIDTSQPFFVSTVLGRVAVLLGLRTPEARNEAAGLLERFHQVVEMQHAERLLIEVTALQAVLFAQAGVREGALELLERAVSMTIPGDAVRILADLDFLIGPLMDELAEGSSVKTQIHRIRRAAQVYRRGSSATALNARARMHDRSRSGQQQARSARSVDLVESLTYREMDVLQLLVERPTNKEIARELNISTETVKRHMVNIFQKLNVENRRQAVSQARNLGILPEKV